MRFLSSTFKFQSLVRRLIAWQAVVMSVACIALLAWLYAQMVAYESGDLDRRMRYLATILAETAAATQGDATLSARVTAVERVFVEGVIQTIDNANSYSAVYQVFDASERLVHKSADARVTPYSSELGFKNIVVNGDSLRAVRVVSSDQRFTVIAAESGETRFASLWPMLSIIATSQLVIFAVCLAALTVTTRLALNPLREFANALNQRRAGDLSPLVLPQNFSELAPLIDAFNQLFAQETLLRDRERAFIADATHELRTPLAALSAQAHRIATLNDESSRAHATSQLKAGLMRVSHLLSQLLTTARVESSPVYTDQTRFNLAELLRERLADLSTEAQRKNIQLALHAPDILNITGSRIGLASIIDNLVDNAIRYTPEAGAVSVTLREANENVMIAVEDTGPGIDAQYRTRVFERFYRVPGTSAPGTGLGLAIVQRLTSLYSGRVELSDGQSRRGLAVTVSIPQVST